MLSTLLSLALLPQAQDATRPQAVFERISLQHLCAPQPDLSPLPWGTLLTYLRPEKRLDLLGVADLPAQFYPEQIVEQLRGLHTQEFEAGTLRLEASGNSLHVFGDGPTVALLREQLRDLGAIITRPLEIEVTLWDAGNAPAPAAVLGPKQFAQFAEQHTAVWHGITSTRSSIAVRLDQQRWTRYVRDVDVEVAQKATIAQPMTDTFGEGVGVIVVPHALVGGDDFVLHTQFALGERRGAVMTMATGSPDQPDLDVPLLETTFGACSGRVANGGALAVSATGLASGGGNRVLTIRVTSKVPPVATGSTELGVFPTSAITRGSLTQLPQPPNPYPQIGDADQPAPSADTEPGGFGMLEEGDLLDLIRGSLGAATETDFNMQMAGGFLLVHADVNKIARVEAVLRPLQERLLRNVTVRHTARLMPTEGTAPTPWHELVVPTLLGRCATLCRMLETNVLRDVFVEIAQEAVNHDPVVEAMQSGAWLRACVEPLGDGMHLQMLCQEVQAEAPLLRRLVPAGALSLASVGSTRATHNGAVVSGQGIDHGDGPLLRFDGRACRSALVKTVRW